MSRPVHPGPRGSVLAGGTAGRSRRGRVCKITSARKLTRTKASLILRSRAKRGVSKDGQQHDWFPPFETRPCGPLLRVRPWVIRFKETPLYVSRRKIAQPVAQPSAPTTAAINASGIKGCMLFSRRKRLHRRPTATCGGVLGLLEYSIAA